MSDAANLSRAPATTDAQTSDSTTRLLLTCGVIGPALFTVVYLLEGATRPGYDPWVQAVSALSLSGWGWMQIVNFLVSGALFVGFAIGLRRAFAAGSLGSHGSSWGPRLIALVGLGLIMAGIFVTDAAQGYPPGTPGGPSVTNTWHGLLHVFTGAFPVFGVLPIACFIMARSFSGRAGWRAWALLSVVAGLAMWGFFAGFIVAGLGGGPAGLYERLSLIAGFGWVALLAFRLLRAGPTPVAQSPRP